MKKRLIVAAALAAFACLALTGCFGMGSPQVTAPPEASFATPQALADVVANAKADTSVKDTQNLKALTAYYALQTVPEGMKLANIKVSEPAVILQYANGPLVEDKFDNQVTIGWYRSAQPESFLSDQAQALKGMGISSDTITSNGMTYLHMNATISSEATASPAVTAATPSATAAAAVAQVVYWVQDGQAFVGFVPVSFTNDDIGKYCRPQKVELGQ